MWDEIPAAVGRDLPVGSQNRPTCSTRPTSTASPWSRARLADIKGARVLGIFGDSITTDHISPAGGIRPTSPAGQYLQAQGVAVEDFNTYGARRGNHEVMMRGTFANVRIKNLMVPGTEGGITIHQPSGEQTTIYDAAMSYKDEGVPLGGLRRRRIRPGLFARLGSERPAVARRQSCRSCATSSASTAPTWSSWACCRSSSRPAPARSR